MDKMLLKKTAVQSVALMIAVITLSYALRQYSQTVIYASDIHSAEAALLEPGHEEASQSEGRDTDGFIKTEQPGTEDEPSDKETAVLPGMLQDADPEIIKQLGDKQIIIKKPSVKGLTLNLKDIYITKSILLTLSSEEAFQMDTEDIGRINQQDIFIGSPIYTETTVDITDPKDGTVKTEITKDYGSDVVHGISYDNPEQTDEYRTELMLELDNVYAHSIMEDEAYYYIGLKKPSEVYDRILVIDAGHGGKDAGALSRDESVYEKNINVALLLELKQLLDQENIKVYYTRLGDDKVFLKPRVGLANAVDCDYFISIHCNASGSTKPSGTEIFYYATDFKQVSTKALATIFSEEIEKTTSLKNRGLVPLKKDDVYILNHSNVPAVLIETGYMTNLNDLEYMNNKDNQKAIARGIYNGILRAYDEIAPVR